MRRHFRNLFFAILRYSGLPFLLRQTAQKGKVTIVVYHAPSADIARKHFAALKRHYQIIPLADYLRARADSKPLPLPRFSLIVTLDDGHRSNFELKPVLDELRVPVTIFLCSGLVGTQRHFWWLHARNAMEAETCKKMPDRERLRFLRERNYQINQEYPDRQALSLNEIEQLNPWVDFQAHTVNHPILPACTDEVAAREISECKTDLEREFNFKIRALAFPNGDYSQRDIQFAREAGYDCALTLEDGSNNDTTDLFELKRIPLPDDCPVNELLVKTSGLWGMLCSRGSRKAPAASSGQNASRPSANPTVSSIST